MVGVEPARVHRQRHAERVDLAAGTGWRSHVSWSWQVCALRPAAGWPVVVFGLGCRPWRGLLGQNRVKAATNTRIFDVMFSAIGSGADG